MRENTNPKALPDDELLRRLAELVGRSRHLDADVVAHIAEVDARRLYAQEAMPSMFAYCVERLRLGENEAYLRIAAARASRDYPLLLDMLREGQLHLTAVARLASHLTPENHKKVLAQAANRSKRELEEVIAALAPRPDVAATIRKLPVRSGAARSVGSADQEGQPASERPEGLVPELVPERVESSGLRSGPGSRSIAAGGVQPSRPPRQTLVEPLAPARFRVQFTADARLRDKLERLQALMRASVPDGDLGKIIEEAVTEKLERLEAKRWGKTDAPRKSLAQTDAAPTSRHIPAPVRRAVWARDGGRCTFANARGTRCPARARLEFHHHGKPFARGGDHSPENVRLMCRTHNALMAERDFGRKTVEQFRRRPAQSGRVSEVTPAYGSEVPGAAGSLRAPP